MTVQVLADDLISSRFSHLSHNEVLLRKSTPISASTKKKYLSANDVSLKPYSNVRSIYFLEIIDQLHVQISEAFSTSNEVMGLALPADYLTGIDEHFQAPSISPHVVGWPFERRLDSETDNQTELFQSLVQQIPSSVYNERLQAFEQVTKLSRQSTGTETQQGTRVARSIIGWFSTKKSYAGQQFLPSKQLTEQLHREFESYVTILRPDLREEVAKALTAQGDLATSRKAFGLVLADLFTTIALRAFDGVYVDAMVTNNKEFTSYFQHALMDAFPIRPSAYPQFSARLRRELIDFIEGDGEISGRWGKVNVEKGELTFELLSQIDRGIQLEKNWEFSSFEE